MHGTPVHSSVIADVLFILAASRGSRLLLEWAIALRAMATGKLGMPPGMQQTELGRRIAQNFLDPQWNVAVRAALGNTQIEYLAQHFYKCCITTVPTNAQYPIADENWLVGARALYWKEPSLQMLANALLGQLRLSSENAVAAPAPPAAQPVAVAAPVPPPSHEMWTKLIARLRLIARAKRFVEQFVRQWEARKVRAAAARATQQAAPLPVASLTETEATAAIPALVSSVAMPTAAHAPIDFECMFVPPSVCTPVPLPSPGVNRCPVAATSQIVDGKLGVSTRQTFGTREGCTWRFVSATDFASLRD